MLTFFRENATNWIIKVALFLIVIVFIFWGGYSYQSRKDTQMARVGDYYISIADYNQSYDRLLDFYRAQMGDSFSEETIRQLDLKQQALDGLIRRYVLLKKSGEMGLSATTEEVQAEIVGNSVFHTDGKFDHDRYMGLLQQNRLTPEAFENQVAQDISVRKIEAFIKRQAVVTDDEVLADLHSKFSQIQAGYVVFDPKTFEDQAAVEEDALKKFYKDHPDLYKSQEKRQFDFVIFRPDLKNIRVTEDEIRSDYEANKQDKYHEQHQVKARHILFRVTENAPEEEVARVRTEAEKILEQAKKGEDFIELAKKHSQEPGAAERGGDLGFFTRDRMVPTFSEAAFSMKKGEISENLVRTPFGFHIIKVEDIRPERTIPFEEVKPQIELTLKWDKAREIARNKAQDFADAAYAEADLKKAAKAQKLPIVSTKEWVAQADPIKELGANPESMKELFTLQDKIVSKVLEFPQGSVVAQVKAIQPPQTLPFEQVRDRVEKDFKAEKSQTLAEQKAAEFLKLAKAKKSLEEAAKEAQKEMKKSQWLSRREPDATFPLQGKMLDPLFSLEKTRPFPEAPVKSPQGYVVYQLLGKQPPKKEMMEKERSSTRDQIAYQKQNQLWQAWLSEQTAKADVEMLQEL